MLMLRLAWEFFKIGLFAIGGGMATLPFLQHLADTTGWFDQTLITDMIAISESTPGPIGINMATYVGYNIAGVPGGIVATLSEIIPSIVIVSAVSRTFTRFRENKLAERAFYGLRPAVTGLIAAAGFQVIRLSLLNLEAFFADASLRSLFAWPKLILFAAALFAFRRYKKNPVLYIAVSAVLGIVLRLN